MKLILTKEQLDIINLAKTGKNICIKAFAGAAKTSTCIMLAEALGKDSLYLAFNKSIADEAKDKFSFNTTCQTINSLAWRAVVKSGKSKFGQKLKYLNINDIDIPGGFSREQEYKLRIEVRDLVDSYCQSAYMMLDDFLVTLEEPLDTITYKIVYEYWNKLINEYNPATINHNVYLKLFQLSKPTLDFDLIMLDEAQDSNPVTLDIVLNQKQAQIIIVGDEYQAIYEWRGAINAFDIVETSDISFETMYLTESFRFTQEIADYATKLTRIAGNEKDIIGRASIVHLTPESNLAYIVRTNATLLSYLSVFASQGKIINCLADLKSLWSKLYHINSLFFKQYVKFPDEELKQFKSYEDLIKAAEYDINLKKLVNFTTQLSTSTEGLHGSITKIKACLFDPDKHNTYDYTVTTAHKSKGLEWDEVILADDMLYVKDEQSVEEALSENQTLNLIYVAITRAKYKVSFNSVIRDIIDYYEDYYI